MSHSTSEFDNWLETAKQVGNDFLTGLKGDEKDIAVSAIRLMATLKAKAIMSQPATYGKELALLESVLQDMTAVVSLDVVSSLRDLMRRSAGQVMPLLEGLFTKVLGA